jgi:putative endonuclease
MTKNKELGDWGEKLAADFLLRKGFSLVKSNQRCGSKELDLIAYEDDILVFVEVKTRLSSRYGEAIEMIGRNKLGYLKKAALGYLARVRPPYRTIRFDAIAIDVDQLTKCARIKHYKDII